MATMEEREDLNNWEKMMACCFPCGLVWFKEGTGSACCLNVVLGCLLGSCCVNVCHACSFVGEPSKPGSPCGTIAAHGEGAKHVPVVKQPQF